MKNLAAILVFVFAFTFTAQAQKKGKGKKPSVENIIKKLTKDLSLTEAQQNDLKPLLLEQMTDRKAMGKKMKAMKANGQKPSKEERKQLKAERLAKETSFNTKLASILDKEQLVKFEEIAKKRKEKMKGKMKGKKKKH